MSDTRKDRPDTRDHRQIDRQAELERQQAVIDAVASIDWHTEPHELAPGEASVSWGKRNGD